MNIAKDIRIIMFKNDITIAGLAARLGTSQSNLSHKFKRNNFSIKEMQDIAAVLECNLKITFTETKKKER